MEQFISQLDEEVKECLDVINTGNYENPLRIIEKIKLFENVLERLKVYVYNNDFVDETKEIYFFKEIKPRFFSRLIFHQKTRLNEINRPVGGIKAQNDYLHKELERINDFYVKHKDFYHYYRSGNIYMDQIFFIRGKANISLDIEYYHFEKDAKFSTVGDSIMANILANDLFEEYLLTEICRLENRDMAINLNSHNEVHMTWTGKKIELIELIYAKYCTKSINSGKVSLKQLVSFFERIYNIELSSAFSRAWYDITIRDNPTSFLDKMKNKLNKKMNDG